MNKEDADKLILQYRNQIYGFSLSKLQNIDQAEDLASNIIFEVYMAFLNADHIANYDGYVYRIACNTYSKYIQYLTAHRRLDNIDNMDIPFFDSYSYDTSSEELLALKKEISYLSKRQRTIVYLHYYEKMPVAAIAAKLGISPNTVKWHLSDARSALKEGLIMTETKTNLTVNPVKFTDMGHWGNPGTTGDTSSMFDTRLKQNIAWLCYWQPKTLDDISRDLSVPTAYVADELQKLVDYAYIDQLDNSKNPKYRTNMVIYDNRSQSSDMDAAKKFCTEYFRLYKEAAKKLCAEYFRPLFEIFEADKNHWGLRHGGDDTNFMKYSLTMLCLISLTHTDTSKDFDRFMIKRPDGGSFIAYAAVDDDCQPKNDTVYPYWACGWMNRQSDFYYSIQLDCHYTDRSGFWKDNLNDDWENLVCFIKNDCNPAKLSMDAYKRLCDKGYIHNDQVQVVTLPALVTDITAYLKPYTASLKDIPDHIREYHKEFDAKIYRLQEARYPEHIRPLIRLNNTNLLASGRFVPYLLEELLAQGLLQPLNNIQKKAALSILFYS